MNPVPPVFQLVPILLFVSVLLDHAPPMCAPTYNPDQS